MTRRRNLRPVDIIFPLSCSGDVTFLPTNVVVKYVSCTCVSWTRSYLLTSHLFYLRSEYFFVIITTQRRQHSLSRKIYNLSSKMDLTSNIFTKERGKKEQNLNNTVPSPIISPSKRNEREAFSKKHVFNTFITKSSQG